MLKCVIWAKCLKSSSRNSSLLLYYISSAPLRLSFSICFWFIHLSWHGAPSNAFLASWIAPTTDGVLVTLSRVRWLVETQPMIVDLIDGIWMKQNECCVCVAISWWVILFFLFKMFHRNMAKWQNLIRHGLYDGLFLHENKQLQKAKTLPYQSPVLLGFSNCNGIRRPQQLRPKWARSKQTQTST